MTLLELLNFIAPGLVATDDEKGLALQMAAPYRPWCLPDALQDEAQALYAAWVLTLRAQNQAGGVREFGVVSESEGDLSKTYGDAGAVLDSAGFKARFDALAKRCGARLVRGGCAR